MATLSLAVADGAPADLVGALSLASTPIWIWSEKPSRLVVTSE